MGYTNGPIVARVGRQAITWGNALVFQALDPFNPFSPVDIDKDYKTGDDMFYGQWLMESGDDVQVLAIARRNPETNSIQSNQSTYAGKWHTRFKEIDSDLVVARHYGENFFGGGLALEIFEGIWRFDISVVELERGGKPVNIATNYDRSWIIAGTNVYAYLEYFRSGLGVSDGDYSYLDPELLKRIDRGELFTFGRDYLTLGGRIELTPLVNFYPSSIFNLHDESGIVQLRLNYDFIENFLLITGVNLTWGPRGSEFGGIPIRDTDSFLTSPQSIYARVAYFF